MTDRRLMLIHLRERSAFGWAMRHNAESIEARDGWAEYAETVGALIQELESDDPDGGADIGVPAPLLDESWRRETVLKACGVDETATIRRGRIRVLDGATLTVKEIEYLLVDGADLALARYSPNRPWFEVKASDITPRDDAE